MKEKLLDLIHFIGFKYVVEINAHVLEVEESNAY